MNCVSAGYRVQYKDSYLSYALMLGGYYGATGMCTGLISIYILGKGYTPDKVSLLIMLSWLLSMLIQPIVGRIQNKYNPKRVSILLLIAAGVGSLQLVFADDFFNIVIWYCLFTVMMNCANPLLEKVATQSRHPYGLIRCWGGLGNAIATQVAGIVYARIAPEALYIFGTASLIMCIVGYGGTVSNEQMYMINIYIAKNEKIRYGYKALLTNHSFLLYLCIAGIFYGTTNLAHTYCSAMFRQEGLSVELISTVLLITGLAELPLVIFSNKFMNRISNRILLMRLFAMILLMNALYALPVPVSIKAVATIFLKNTSGMTFVMANLKVVSTLVDEKSQIIALALVNTMRCLTSIAFFGLAGSVLVTYSYSMLYGICFGFVVIGTICLVFLKIPSGNGKVVFH